MITIFHAYHYGYNGSSIRDLGFGAGAGFGTTDGRSCLTDYLSMGTSRTGDRFGNGHGAGAKWDAMAGDGSSWGAASLCDQSTDLATLFIIETNNKHR